MGGKITVSQIEEAELRDLINTLLGMLSEKAESIHLHKKDFDKVKAYPAMFGFSLSRGEVVKFIEGRKITIKAAP